MKKLLLTLILLAETAVAENITFNWDHPGEGPVPTGYRLYYGTEAGNHTESLEVGYQTSTTQNLDLNTYKYFTLVAFNQWGESAKTQELVLGKPGSPTTFSARPGS